MRSIASWCSSWPAEGWRFWTVCEQTANGRTGWHYAAHPGRRWDRAFDAVRGRWCSDGPLYPAGSCGSRCRPSLAQTTTTCSIRPFPSAVDVLIRLLLRLDVASLDHHGRHKPRPLQTNCCCDDPRVRHHRRHDKGLLRRYLQNWSWKRGQLSVKGITRIVSYGIIKGMWRIPSGNNKQRYEMSLKEDEEEDKSLQGRSVLCVLSPMWK